MPDMPNNRRSREELRQSLRTHSLLLLFGLGILAYCIAIDRVEWFSLKPATGTSISLSNASAERPTAATGVSDQR